MKTNYLLVNTQGVLIIWRHLDTAPEVRIFEDGAVAKKHAQLAEQMGFGDIMIHRFQSFDAAQSFVKNLTQEPLWIHHFTLPFGYNDRF